MKRSRRNRHQQTVELNITAFLNLMVILVPFLLITAVFSRMTVLELNLPSLNAKDNATEKIQLQLQLVLTTQDITLRDNNLGDLGGGAIPVSAENRHWRIMSKRLLELKTRFPEEDKISLLVADNVSYRDMIHAMDQLRSIDVVNITDVETYELFPQISIGKIPLATDVELLEGEGP